MAFKGKGEDRDHRTEKEIKILLRQTMKSLEKARETKPPIDKDQGPNSGGVW